VVRGLRRIYQPALEFVLANRIITFSGVALLALMARFALRSLGLEFLPKLEEGNLWIRATFPQSVSLEDSDTYVNRMRVLMSKYPEVQTVVSQHGRPDDGTDATGFFNAEFFVPLKPFDTWPHGVDKEKLTQDMTNALEQQFPGVDFNFSQYIQDNVEEAASGVKGENSVKIYGNDLETLEKKADEIAAVLAKVPGITDLAVLRSLGQPTIRIDVDRTRAARYGLATGDVNAVIQAAIGGQSAGDLYEGTSDRHFPMMVRLSLPYRQNLDAIRRIPIAAASPHRAAGHPSSAGGCRRRAPGLGRGLHLPRAAAALRAHQVQCARPRSRQRGARGAARGGLPGDTAGRLPSGMGG
jgi:cobalt-zinc-cadmium resistance protein CzcA